LSTNGRVFAAIWQNFPDAAGVPISSFAAVVPQATTLRARSLAAVVRQLYLRKPGTALIDLPFFPRDV